MIYNEGNLNQNDCTVVYVKTDIYKHHKLIHFNDSVLLRLEVEFFGNPIIVHALYRSPSTCINQFNQNLQDYLDTQAMDDHKCNFIVGDINIDILDENDNKVSDYLTVMAEYGYKSLINAPTRLETCLDHIFMKPCIARDIEFSIPIVTLTDITDHSTIIVQEVIEKTQNQK